VLRIVVAGTSGGVGATTVAAIVFDGPRLSSTGAPALAAHSAGTLGSRLANGDDVAEVDPSLAVHDLGPHAFTAGLDVFDDPHDLLITVAQATPLGIEDARAVLAAVSDRHGPAGLSRVILVFNAPFGPARVRRPIEQLRTEYGRLGIVVVPRDRALAIGGRIPFTRLTSATRRGQQSLNKRVAELLARHRG
jgi:hypothetical protein